MYSLTMGIEHLMTGAKIHSKSASMIYTFQRESASIVRVIADLPFSVLWPVNYSCVEAQEGDWKQEQYSHGEAEWEAQVKAGAMQDCEQRSYDMQIYERRADYIGPDGRASRWAPGEPARFPEAVIKAMKSKFGKGVNQWLAKLRWDRDHWYFTKDGVYHGVEPDGHIHT